MYPFDGVGIAWIACLFPAAMIAYYWFARLVLARHTTRRESRRQKAQRACGPDFWNPWVEPDEPATTVREYARARRF